MTIVKLSVTHFLLNLIKIFNLMERSHYNTIIIRKSLSIGKTNQNIEKELMTLQLEDLLSPKKIETEDSSYKYFDFISY